MLEAVLTSVVADCESLLDRFTYRSPMWPPYPNPSTFDPNWTQDQTLSDCVRRAAIDLVFNNNNSNVSMALVNLGGANLISPSYAGFQDEVETSIFSTGKICAMYAAYQLREDCRFLAKSLSGISDPSVAMQALRNNLLGKWSDPANPPYVQAIAQTPPRLDRIFELTQDSDGWHVEFSRDTTNTPTPDPSPTDPSVLVTIKSNLSSLDGSSNIPLTQASRDALQNVKFLEWLRLMIGFSNDTAAGFCIRNLGFPFMGALLQQSGLVDIGAGQGLWLASDYDAMHAEDIWTGHLLGGIKQAGNAKSLAKFFTLLKQGSLVSAPAGLEMLGLLDKDLWRSVTSFLGKHISAGGGNKKCTKIGILGDVIHDAGYIHHSTTSGDLDYVGVVLNVNDPAASGDLIANVDDAFESCLSPP